MAANTLLLAQATLLIIGPWALWALTGIRRVAPLAVLQIVVGVLLGPSVLGHIAPAVQLGLFPAAGVPRIGAIAQFGVVLYSFTTGMHLDEFRLSRSTATLALFSFLSPALAGLALAPALLAARPELLPQGGSVAGFTAALALLLTVTALPVLAALLKEMRLIATPFGQKALGLAALNDSAMWLCVAIILIVVAPGTEGSAIALLPVFAAMLALVAWLLRRFGGRADPMMIAILLCGFATLCAATAEMAGLGYVIGAFAAGVIVPRTLRVDLVARLEWPALYLLMPFFFMATGLRIDVDLLSADLLGLVVLLTGTAMFAKLAGTAIAARLTGLGWREGLAIGTAVQTKGLMEVLVATILVDHHVISEVLFAPLILMALICTTATAPILRLLGYGQPARAPTVNMP